MRRFSGKVGFVTTVLTSPGIYEPQEVERQYYGDVVRNSYSNQTTSRINDNITLSNNISIVGDAYALDNFFSIRYIVWKGHKWSVSNVDVTNRPRIILQVGGLYNGNHE